MAKNTYSKKLAAERHKTIYKASMIARQQTIDKFIIALGQLGKSSEEIGDILKEFYDVEHDYCEEVNNDSKVDNNFEYARDVIDRVLKQYLTDDLFVPYEERFSF